MQMPVPSACYLLVLSALQLHAKHIGGAGRSYGSTGQLNQGWWTSGSDSSSSGGSSSVVTGKVSRYGGHNIKKSTSSGSFSKGTAESGTYGYSQSHTNFKNFVESPYTSSGRLHSHPGLTYFFYGHHQQDYAVSHQFGHDICRASVPVSDIELIEQGRPITQVASRTAYNYIYWDCEKGESCDEASFGCAYDWFDWWDWEYLYWLGLLIVLVCLMCAACPSCCCCCLTTSDDNVERTYEDTDAVEKLL